MKAVLSNRIFLQVKDTRRLEKLKEELTYRIPSTFDPEQVQVIRNFSMVRNDIISMPSGRVDLIPEEYEIVDKRVLVPADFPQFKFTLRESQQAIYDDIDDSCIINAKPSWGKTFAGLAIAGKLGQKTLVVVHTVPLRNQWVKEVRKVYGIEPGIIGSGKFKMDSPIVIANVQSLYNCIDQIKSSFGTLILDEMHHVSSPTFTRVVDKCFARYKIGLSGTLERKDGKHVMFKDLFGHKKYVPPAENALPPVIHVYKTGIKLPDADSWAERVNILNSMPEYRDLVVAIAERYARLGHRNLIVADRVEFLQECAARRPKAVAIVGTTKEEDREEWMESIGKTRDEIWGTTSIFKEGISVNILSCLILAAPTNNVPMLEQLIGRIQRIIEGKLPPVLVDLVLDGYTGYNQFQTRLGHYLKMGYEIKYH